MDMNALADMLSAFRALAFYVGLGWLPVLEIEELVVHVHVVAVGIVHGEKGAGFPAPPFITDRSRG